MSKAELVTSRSNGYHRFYPANRKHPVFSNLQGLVLEDVNRRSFVSRRKLPRQNWRTRKERRRYEPSPRLHITIGQKILRDGLKLDWLNQSNFGIAWRSAVFR
jgi:hypothetical protein